MSYQNPRLRGSGRRSRGPHPLGELPEHVLTSLGQQLVYWLAIGQKDLPGNSFGPMFARAVDGQILSGSTGIADIAQGQCAWSVKTVKYSRPFTTRKIRIISGRNSPRYSFDLENPYADLAATGRAVLEIWNARVSEARALYPDLRGVVLIRNMEHREFLLFEREIHMYTPRNFKWTLNPTRNFIGTEKATGNHKFTWQSHGSQFTVHWDVPVAARQLTIVPEIPQIEPQAVLERIGFTEDWLKTS